MQNLMLPEALKLVWQHWRRHMIIWLATKKNQKLPDLSLQYRPRKAAESTLYPCLGRGCLYMPSLHGCCGKCSRSVRGAGQTDLESPFLGEQGMVSTVDEFRTPWIYQCGVNFWVSLTREFGASFVAPLTSCLENLRRGSTAQGFSEKAVGIMVFQAP